MVEYKGNVVVRVYTVVRPAETTFNPVRGVALAACKSPNYNGNIVWVAVPTDDPPATCLVVPVGGPPKYLPNTTAWYTAPSRSRDNAPKSRTNTGAGVVAPNCNGKSMVHPRENPRLRGAASIPPLPNGVLPRTLVYTQ